MLGCKRSKSSFYFQFTDYRSLAFGKCILYMVVGEVSLPENNSNYTTAMYANT